VSLLTELLAPRRNPDYWYAHGRVRTADPIIVFQQLKIVVIELCWAPGIIEKGCLTL